MCEIGKRSARPTNEKDVRKHVPPGRSEGSIEREGRRRDTLRTADVTRPNAERALYNQMDVWKHVPPAEVARVNRAQ